MRGPFGSGTGAGLGEGLAFGLTLPAGPSTAGVTAGAPGTSASMPSALMAAAKAKLRTLIMGHWAQRRMVCWRYDPRPLWLANACRSLQRPLGRPRDGPTPSAESFHAIVA